MLVLSKLYLVAKAALVPSMTETEDDLASANAKLAVLASLAGFVASPIAVGLLQLGAPWVLRLAFVVFLLGGVAAVRLPEDRGAVAAKPADDRPRTAAPSWDHPSPGRVARRREPDVPLYERPANRRTRSARRGSMSPGSGSGSGCRCSCPRSCSACRDVGDQGSGWIPHVLPGLCAPPPPRGDVVVRILLLTSAIGSLLGSLLVPTLRRYLSEQQLILYSLVLSAVVGVVVAIVGSLWVQPLLTLAIGFATTSAKPSFDSIAQRNVPPALLGSRLCEVRDPAATGLGARARCSPCSSGSRSARETS